MFISPSPDLRKLLNLLPSPMRPLQGKHAAPLVLPENIVCFSRHSATDLNRPQRGRALHHRHVLIFALQTSVTVRLDELNVRIAEGQGLLVQPFQFHDYSDAEREELKWLFVTFDMVDDGSLAPLRYRTFNIGPDMAQTATELVQAYLKTGAAADDLSTLLLALLLTRIRQSLSIERRRGTTSVAPGLMTKVNELAESKGAPPSIKEVAGSLGISASHLCTRFRVSCGVSLGKHLRRLRLEKARGLLRLSTRRVSEIADICGFSSVYTFSRAFHAAYDVAPLAYRKGNSVRTLEVASSKKK